MLLCAQALAEGELQRTVKLMPWIQGTDVTRMFLSEHAKKLYALVTQGPSATRGSDLEDLLDSIQLEAQTLSRTGVRMPESASVRLRRWWAVPATVGGATEDNMRELEFDLVYVLDVYKQTRVATAVVFKVAHAVKKCLARIDCEKLARELEGLAQEADDEEFPFPNADMEGEWANIGIFSVIFSCFCNKKQIPELTTLFSFVVHTFSAVCGRRGPARNGPAGVQCRGV